MAVFITQDFVNDSFLQIFALLRDNNEVKDDEHLFWHRFFTLPRAGAADVLLEHERNTIECLETIHTFCNDFIQKVMEEEFGRVPYPQIDKPIWDEKKPILLIDDLNRCLRTVETSGSFLELEEIDLMEGLTSSIAVGLAAAQGDEILGRLVTLYLEREVFLIKNFTASLLLVHETFNEGMNSISLANLFNAISITKLSIDPLPFWTSSLGQSAADPV